MPGFTNFNLFSLFFLFVVGCASTTQKGATNIDRNQFVSGISSEKMIEISKKSYRKLILKYKKEGLLDKNSDHFNRVSTVLGKLIPQVSIFRSDAINWAWEFHIVDSPLINATCLPGGKMMITSGIINQLQLDDNELAAVLGHEMSHALREHGREKISEQYLIERTSQTTFALLTATGSIDGTSAFSASQASTELLNRWISQPHIHEQEIEADAMGIELMARAGFNPEAALSLWNKISQKTQSEYSIKTHPSNRSRIEHIQATVEKVLPIYNALIIRKSTSIDR